jgi:hypothetical protein
MRFTDIFIKRPVLSVVVSLLILLIGLRAAMVLPIRQYPKLSNTVINITTVYPGASADLIQGFITTPIEQAVASAEGVDYMTSSSVLGTSTIQVYIKLNFDPNQALTEVLAKTNSVKYLIPKESHGRDVSRLLLRRAVGLGDIRLSDACGAAGAVDGRRRGLGRHSGRPDLCDAAVARSHEDGRPQRVAGRCRRRDRRQQLPVRSGADQGLSDRFQHLDEHQPD